MSRRIEVELTSAREDGTWTWRAAGARQPKGVLDGGLLYEGAKVGDVVRADAEFDVDGITVTAVLPPKGARREPERLEVLGPQRNFTPVTSTLAQRDRGDRRPRDRERRPGGGGRPDRQRRDRRPTGERRDERPRRERPAPPPPRPKAKKLRPGRAHREAFLASLPPEQQPIAEQALRGGMPAVRTALNEQNTRAKAEGKPEVPVTAVIAIAEELIPAVRLAEWLDRAEAAVADAEELSLQDLRSVVVSAPDVARDERARELADHLRSVLDRRAPVEQAQWVADVDQSLAAGRVVRALRLAARPPQPSEALPDELANRIKEAAGAALTADIEPQRWATVLDAVAYSPFRRDVVPQGIPAEPGDELLALVRKHAGRSPAIAALFGVETPTGRESRRRKGSRGQRGARNALSRPVLGPGGRRVPPPPPRPDDTEVAGGDQPSPAGSAGAEPTTPSDPTVAAEPAPDPEPTAPPGEAAADGAATEAPREREAVEVGTPVEADPVPGPGGPAAQPDPAAAAEASNGSTVADPMTHPGPDDPRPHGDALVQHVASDPADDAPPPPGQAPA